MLILSHNLQFVNCSVNWLEECALCFCNMYDPGTDKYLLFCRSHKVTAQHELLPYPVVWPSVQLLAIQNQAILTLQILRKPSKACDRSERALFKCVSHY